MVVITYYSNTPSSGASHNIHGVLGGRAFHLYVVLTLARLPGHRFRSIRLFVRMDISNATGDVVTGVVVT